ncbi:MAG: SRPBCC family protein [Candidatus Palauibacterales bacterium]|nr:SRPBCC family protein [Candidatus Palauibacterales bacterium]MDP2529681.1 SRPBCC family protein [Candidatus Palauibacterales bacterium]MDP2584097.1 SRPBCC family protein [Candidatus Palauibacterales bacterium]
MSPVRRPGEHVLQAETTVPRPLGEVFAFFAAAENLQRLTPPEMDFRIMTPLPIPMAAGTLIDYRLRLFGMPFRWRTRIDRWEPPDRFVDEQLEGPYAVWVHTHSFREVEAGTRVRDHVRYALPVYPAGELAFPVVRLQLRRIFGYRKRRLRELLGERL